MGWNNAGDRDQAGRYPDRRGRGGCAERLSLDMNKAKTKGSVIEIMGEYVEPKLFSPIS